jgi:SAM-dependent methyltransferase
VRAVPNLPQRIGLVGADLAARSLTALNRAAGLAYTRGWPLFGLTWFDHRFDYLRGPRDWQWAERGVLAARWIRPESVVLDLCCGEGFYAHHFYAPRAAWLDGVDRDATAIAQAQRGPVLPNARFVVGDALRDPFPRAAYDVVVCMAAIQNFSATELPALLEKIGAAIQPTKGLFIGSTALTTAATPFPEHITHFTSAEQLRSILETHFGSVTVWPSPWPAGRVEVYFECRAPRADAHS